MKLYLVKPSGFCAGVQRAVHSVERSIALWKGPVHVRHEIVHNRSVVDALRQRGAIFVDEVDQIPEGGHMILSAHGAGRAVRQAAAQRRLSVVDATCPLVRKVHLEIQRFHAQGREVVLIGHAGHPEVVASLDQSDGVLHLVQHVADARSLAPAQPDRLAFVTQTTLSVDETAAIAAVLRERFPSIVSPSQDDICFAAQNRQAAVKALAGRTRRIVVVGSSHSSNATRLREVAECAGARACLLDDPAALESSFLAGSADVGLAAGASSPSELIVRFVERLRALGVTEVEEFAVVDEHHAFPMPPMPLQAEVGTV